MPSIHSSRSPEPFQSLDSTSRLPLAKTRLNPHLARSTRRNILASRALLTTSNVVTTPSPVAAAPRSTKDINICTRAGNSTSNTLKSNVRHSDTVGGGTSRPAIQIILLHINTILADIRESDVLKAHTSNRTRRPRDSLNAHPVHRVDNLRRRNRHVADGVIATTTDGTNRQPVSAVAVPVREGDMLARVNSQTVVLVVHRRVVDVDIRAGADVESVRVMAQARAGAVVD